MSTCCVMCDVCAIVCGFGARGSVCVQQRRERHCHLREKNPPWCMCYVCNCNTQPLSSPDARGQRCNLFAQALRLSCGCFRPGYCCCLPLDEQHVGTLLRY